MMDHMRLHPDDYNPPLANWYSLSFPVADGFEEQIDAACVNHWRHRKSDGQSAWKKGRAPMSEPLPDKFADKDITETLAWLDREVGYIGVLGGDEELDITPLRRAETLIRRLAREAGYRLIT